MIAKKVLTVMKYK